MPVRIQKEPFDINHEIRTLLSSTNNAGAVVTFIGLVRGQNTRGNIKSMYLEHYPGMTEKQIKLILKEARKRWKLLDCLIIHRYGRLQPSEEIVLVICISNHRKEAFDAANFLMDWLKTKAPFWKKEEYKNDSLWVEAKSKDEQEAEKWNE